MSADQNSIAFRLNFGTFKANFVLIEKTISSKTFSDFLRLGFVFEKIEIWDPPFGGIFLLNKYSEVQITHKFPLLLR